MNRKEFIELGTDIFGEYLPKVKASDRKLFLETFLDELEGQGVVSLEDGVPERTTEDTESLEGLFDSYSDED